MENGKEEALQAVRALIREAVDACQDLSLLDLVYKLLVGTLGA